METEAHLSCIVGFEEIDGECKIAVTAFGVEASFQQTINRERQYLGGLAA